MLPTLSLTENEKDIVLRSENNDWSTPEFKLKQFVGNSHIHPMHRVQQYMMELNARRDSIDQYQYEIEKYEAEILIQEQYKDLAKVPAEALLNEVEIKDLNRKLLVSKTKIKTLETDIKKFLKLIKEFNDSPNGKNENGELWMDLLKDPVEKERVESEYWSYRLAKQAAVDLIAYGRIGSGNIDAIMQLEGDEQNKCLAMAYEVLLLNEHRMNKIQDGVQQRLSQGVNVSDITKLISLEESDFLLKLQENQEKVDVPLIQKR